MGRGRGRPVASALSAGLLIATQGIGAALVMPISGRLTDRIGGGRVALFGIAAMTVATLPLVAVGSMSSYAWLAFVLLVRGIGLGCAMMPTMASAYAVVRRDQVPEATSVINALQRVGGSIGTALLAVVLSDQASSVLGSGVASSGGLIQTLSPAVGARVAGPLASAFGHTFWWALGALLLALIPTTMLVITQRRERQATAAGASRSGALGVPRVRSHPTLSRYDNPITASPAQTGPTAPQTLGAELERDRLEHRVRTGTVAIHVLRQRASEQRRKLGAPTPHLQRAIADFEARAEAINARLRDLVHERASTQFPRSRR